MTFEYVCEATTTGGPVAIMPLCDVRFWDGYDDYFRATSLLIPRQFSSVPVSQGRAFCHLFHQEVDGNFHVFRNEMSFAVITEDYSTPESTTQQRFPTLGGEEHQHLVAVLPKFGGLVCIFDAAIRGSDVRLKDVGCDSTPFDTGEVAPHFDTVVIKVPHGSWNVFEVQFADEKLAFDGVVFSLVLPGQGEIR